MINDLPQPIGPHDLGGSPAGPIDRTDHDVAFWEQRVDAMLFLLRKKGVMRDPAQLRRGIESLGKDVYDSLSYYERWAGSLALNAIEQGLISREELDKRIAEIKSRKEAE